MKKLKKGGFFFHVREKRLDKCENSFLGAITGEKAGEHIPHDSGDVEHP